MDKHEEERPPLNERAALEQLEQFKNDIERYRRQRKAVGEEFEHFVKSFKTPQTREPHAPQPATARPPASRPPEVPRAEASPAPPASRISPAPPLPPASPARPADVARSPATAPPPLSRKTADAVAVADPRIEPRAAVAPSQAEPMPLDHTQGTSRRPSPVVIFAVLLLAAGVAAWYFWPQQTDEATAPATVTAPAPQPTTPAPAEPAAPTQAAAPSTETVVTTLDRVWVRVIADGVKVREDELPAGTRIPVDVKKTLVIRTGNAAAVSLVLAGKDLGALGAEGQVVTRSFTVPEK